MYTYCHTLSPPDALASCSAGAREIMDELGAFEPSDRAATIRELSKPVSCNPEGKKGGEHWPINGKTSSPEDDAWSFIFGIEDGWFEYDRSGHLNWSQKGRDRYAAGDEIGRASCRERVCKYG